MEQRLKSTQQQFKEKITKTTKFKDLVVLSLGKIEQKIGNLISDLQQFDAEDRVYNFEGMQPAFTDGIELFVNALSSKLKPFTDMLTLLDRSVALHEDRLQTLAA